MKKQKDTRAESPLAGWIVDELDRDDPPFPRGKHMACLYQLYSHRLYTVGDIANECGVKYNVLKFWRTESNFKAQVKSYMEDYGSYYRAIMTGENTDDMKTIFQHSGNSTLHAL